MQDIEIHDIQSERNVQCIKGHESRWVHCWISCEYKNPDAKNTSTIPHKVSEKKNTCTLGYPSADDCKCQFVTPPKRFSPEANFLGVLGCAQPLVRHTPEKVRICLFWWKMDAPPEMIQHPLHPPPLVKYGKIRPWFKQKAIFSTSSHELRAAGEKSVPKRVKMSTISRIFLTWNFSIERCAGF